MYAQRELKLKAIKRDRRDLKEKLSEEYINRYFNSET